MGYKALVQERAELVAEGRTIFESAEKASRELTAEEKSRDDEINTRLEAIKPDLAREETRRERERGMASPGRIAEVRDLGDAKPWGYDLSPNKPEAAAMGDFLKAVHAASIGRGLDPRLLIGAVAQGANTTVDADGGFLMPVTMANRIMAIVTGGQILGRLSPLTLDAGSDTLTINVLDEVSRATGSRKGGIQGYWLDEATAPTATRPKFARIELKLRRVAALGYATDDLLRNVGALQGWFTSYFADELRFLAEDATINGSGAGMPLGLLASPCLVTITKETGQAADTIVKENIDKMWARFYAPSRSNAVWLINQQIEPQLNAMTMVVGLGGVPVYLPAGGLSVAPYGNLYGRPVIPVEYCAALGDVGDIILADWSEYAWIQGGGVESATSIHVAFTTFEQCFRAIWRVDGQPFWRTVLTPFKGTANTLSPFVTLGAR